MGVPGAPQLVLRSASPCWTLRPHPEIIPASNGCATSSTPTSTIGERDAQEDGDGDDDEIDEIDAGLSLIVVLWPASRNRAEQLSTVITGVALRSGA
jgi:hypothetical protein